MQPPKTNQTTGFTLTQYRRLLEATVTAYPCVGFEVVDQSHLQERFAIIRHDIDMSPQQALAMAEIESSLGIRATYTVLLTGEFYSPFERKARELLRAIAILGHDIGLHFDAAWHDINSEARLERALDWEAGILNELLNLQGNKRVQMFSFHNTTPFTMACKRSHYASLRNAYAGILQCNVQYTSDSNGYWIHRGWDQILGEGHPRVQILTHPEWWRDLEAEPGEKLCQDLRQRSHQSWLSYCQVLENCKRKNRVDVVHAQNVLPALFGDEGDWLLMLWLEGRKREAYVELFCRFERQSRRLLRKFLRTELRAPGAQVNALLQDYQIRLDTLLALAAVARVDFQDVINCGQRQYRKLKNIRNALVHGYGSISKAELSMSFDQLALAIDHLAKWGKVNSRDLAGTWKLTTAGMPNKHTNDSSLIGWLKTTQVKLQLSDKAIREFANRHQVFSMDQQSLKCDD